MAFIFFAPPLRTTRLRPVFAAVFVVFVCLSAYSTYQGTHNPWNYAQPPFQLTRNSETGQIGAKWNVRLR